MFSLEIDDNSNDDNATFRASTTEELVEKVANWLVEESHECVDLAGNPLNGVDAAIALCNGEDTDLANGAGTLRVV